MKSKKIMKGTIIRIKTFGRTSINSGMKVKVVPYKNSYKKGLSIEEIK